MAEMRQFPFYSALWNGFYNRAFYASVARSWRWQGFAYMALLVLIVLLPPSYIGWRGVDAFIDREMETLLPQMPVFTVKDGKITTQAEEPLFVNGADGERLGVIDTQSKQFRTPQEAKVQFLINGDSLLIALHGDAVSSVPIAPFLEGQTMDQAKIQAIIGGISWPFVFIGMFIMTYLFRLAVAVFYALVGMAFCRAKTLDIEMGFDALYQIGLVAQGTSVLAFNGVMLLLLPLGVFPSSPVFGVLLAVYFVWFGIRSTRDWLAQDLPPLKERF